MHVKFREFFAANLAIQTLSIIPQRFREGARQSDDVLDEGIPAVRPQRMESENEWEFGLQIGAYDLWKRSFYQFSLISIYSIPFLERYEQDECDVQPRFS